MVEDDVRRTPMPAPCCQFTVPWQRRRGSTLQLVRRRRGGIIHHHQLLLCGKTEQ